jgi:hypothetical protein
VTALAAGATRVAGLMSETQCRNIWQRRVGVPAFPRDALDPADVRAIFHHLNGY